MMEEFEMSIAYGILCVISLALIGVCLAVDRMNCQTKCNT